MYSNRRLAYFSLLLLLIAHHTFAVALDRHASETSSGGGTQQSYHFEHLTDPSQFSFSEKTLKKLGLLKVNRYTSLKNTADLLRDLPNVLALHPVYALLKKQSDAVQQYIHAMEKSHWGKLSSHLLLPKDVRAGFLKKTKESNAQWVKKNKNFSSNRFSHAVGVLGGIAGIPEEKLTRHAPEFFGGVAMHCRRLSQIPLSKSCCAFALQNHGLSVNSCDEEAISLAYARRALRVHKVGEYCSKRVHYVVGKTCLEHTQVYCVFDSRLARVIQEKGRAQIRAHTNNNKDLSWGYPRNPHCAGFSNEDLLSLNWSDMHLENTTVVMPQQAWSAAQKTTLQSQVKNTVSHLKKKSSQPKRLHHNPEQVSTLHPRVDE